MAAGLPESGSHRECICDAGRKQADEQIADLRKGTIEPVAPMKSPKVNVVMVKDPDGHSIAFAQGLSATMALKPATLPLDDAVYR